MLLAAIAPRSLYVTNAYRDLWVDPRGTYLSVLNTRSVYDLYGIAVNLPLDPPGVNRPITTSHIGYHIREGDHDMTAYDWPSFIDFTRNSLK